MAKFEIHDTAQLCKLLAVAPQEVDHVLGRLDRYYRNKKIAKRDGHIRELRVPCGKLKLFQEKIKLTILDKAPCLPCVHGGVKRRSVRSNALPHVRKEVVFTIDIKDFFPHVTPDRVCRIFCGLGFAVEPAKLLTKATTCDNQLPQGSSTSTALANLALNRVDTRIFKLCELHGFSYTRYVDDLSVSGGERLLGFRKLIVRIVESEGFRVKPNKTETMHKGTRQMVTRLVVNSKVNMPREWRRELRKQVLNPAESGVSSDTVRGRVNWLSYLNKAASRTDAPVRKMH